MNDDKIPIELWQYKYDEVVGFHTADFGEVSTDKAEKFNNEITNPDIDRVTTYKKTIRYLYISLLTRNLENLYTKIKKFEKGTITFSSIEWEMQQIEDALKKTQTIDDLKKIYIDKLKPIMLSVADNVSILKYKGKQQQKYLIINVIIAILIAICSILFGAYLQKHGLMTWI